MSTSQPDGAVLIAHERMRQMMAEGWTPERDDQHENGEMALAAIAYAAPVEVQALIPVEVLGNEDCGCREADCPHRFTIPQVEEQWVDPWPWDSSWDKRDKHSRIRRLVIAGALIAAEIDRLQRIANPQPKWIADELGEMDRSLKGES